jgi:hypothetical protein
VGALGARFADADRDRAHHRAPHRLPRAAGSVYRKRPRTIYLRRGLRRPRSVLLHELGHLFDLRVMNNGDGRRFRTVLGARSAADPDDLPAALSASVTSTTHAVVEVTFVA